jgi:hypothetical protein
VVDPVSPDAVSSLMREFPLVTGHRPARLVDEVVGWSSALADDPEYLNEPRSGKSRAMLNTLVGAARERHHGRHHRRILHILEGGLALVKPKTSLGKLLTRLYTDDNGFEGVLAELAVLRRVVRVARDYELEVPSRDGLNYDIRLHLENAVSVALEVKYRAETMLGGISEPSVGVRLAKLLDATPTFDRLLYVHFQKNTLSDEEIAAAAVSIEAALNHRQKLVEQPSLAPGLEQTMEHTLVGHKLFPRRLAPAAYEALRAGRQVSLAKPASSYVLCVDDEFHFDDPVLRSVSVTEGPRDVLVLGVAESRPLLSEDARRSFGAQTQRFDDQHPEHIRLAPLLDHAADQLPLDPYSLVVVGRASDGEFYSVEQVVMGEPMRQPDGTTTASGARFGTPAWSHVSGVLAFALPSALLGTYPTQLYENGNAPRLPRHVLASIVCALAAPF